LKDATAVAFQMIGVFYPLALCAAASLVRPGSISVAAPRSSRTWWSSAVMGLTVVSILLHLPRFLAAVHRYGRGAQDDERYSAAQMNGLSKAIGTSTVDVDVGDNTWFALPLLIEIGRRTSRLQWSPGSWSAILSYRGWPVPSYPAPGDLRLIGPAQAIEPGEKIIYRTNQFRLIRRAEQRQ
jgi:hypothetical protein